METFKDSAGDSHEQPQWEAAAGGVGAWCCGGHWLWGKRGKGKQDQREGEYSLELNYRRKKGGREKPVTEHLLSAKCYTARFKYKGF